MGFEVAQCGGGRLFHHVAQAAGHGQPALPFVETDFDEQDVAAHLRPGQAYSHARGHFLLVMVVAEPGRPDVALHIFGVDQHLACLFHSDLFGHAAHDACDAAVEGAHARLAGVLLDDPANRLDGYFHLRRLQPMLFLLLRDEVALCDLHLLLGRITADVDDLHAVEQSGLNGGERVGSGNEHHLGEVVLHLQIVIVESGVLLRIEHFQQSRRGVAAEILAHLVDLVENKHRVGRTCFLDRLQYPARHRADVGLPVPPDLRLVVQATQRHADELAPQRIAD